MRSEFRACVRFFHARIMLLKSVLFFPRLAFHINPIEKEARSLKMKSALSKVNVHGELVA